MALAPYYRLYDLPWSPTEEVERRFRKVVRNAFIIFAIFAMLIPLLPVPEQGAGEGAGHSRSHRQAGASRRRRRRRRHRRRRSRRRSPSRIKKVEQPKPPPPKPDAREKAQNSGLLKLQDQLADLRDNSVLDKAAMTKNLTGKVGETTQFGALADHVEGRREQRRHQHRQPEPRLRRRRGLADRPHHHAGDFVRRSPRRRTTACERGAGSGKASRSDEEIALIFDRNKGAIYALYTRALRDKPDLQGKLVLELTIAPDGRDHALRSRVERAERSGAGAQAGGAREVVPLRGPDVGTITVTKPIDFFPA